MTEFVDMYDPVEREIKWKLVYFEKWNRFPDKQSQNVLEKFWQHKNVKILNEALGKMNVYHQLIWSDGKSAADIAVIKALSRAIAKRIVKASVNGDILANGRSAAMFVEEMAKYVAARGTNGVITISSLPFGVISLVAYMIEDAIANLAGIMEPHTRNAFSADGLITNITEAGSFVGGPIGAAASVAVGTRNRLISQGISSLLGTNRGPDHNWCLVEVSDIGARQVCIGTYDRDDTMYWKADCNEHMKSNSKCIVSTGQARPEPFQLSIWKGHMVIKHFECVHSGDEIGITMVAGRFYIVLCKGENHLDGGTTEMYQCKVLLHFR